MRRGYRILLSENTLQLWKYDIMHCTYGLKNTVLSIGSSIIINTPY